MKNTTETERDDSKTAPTTFALLCKLRDGDGGTIEDMEQVYDHAVKLESSLQKLHTSANRVAELHSAQYLRANGDGGRDEYCTFLGEWLPVEDYLVGYRVLHDDATVRRPRKRSGVLKTPGELPS